MKNIIFLISVLSIIDIQAQVGFNTNTPHPSSIIEMNADDKGLLIPRMSSLNRRQNIANPANSLLVYDITEKAFYFRETTANKWTILNPWDQTDTEAIDDIYTHSDVKNVGIGTSTPGSKLSVAGNLAVGAGVANTATTPTNGALIQGNVHLQSNLGIGAAPTANRLHVQGNAMITGTISADEFALNQNGHGPVPAGGIIMWSGAPNAIPVGYVLCNGGTYLDKDGVNRTTPNLSGKFVVGYDASTLATPVVIAPNDTNRRVNYGAVGNSGGENFHTLIIDQLPTHNHGGITAGTGAHTHTYIDYYRNTTSDGGGGGLSTRAWDGFQSDTRTTTGTGNHSHTINADGKDQPHENRPPYYVIAYIMKKY